MHGQQNITIYYTKIVVFENTLADVRHSLHSTIKLYLMNEL